MTDNGKWTLACMVCRTGWPEDANMGDVNTHWNEHEGTIVAGAHGTFMAEPDKPYLELVWTGPGPEPKPKRRH